MKIESSQPLLPEIIELHAKWRTHETAIIFQGRELSWLEYNRKLNQVANGLYSAGIRKNDRIAVFMANDLSVLIVLLGIMKSGAVAVPLNLSISDETAEMQIRDAQCAAIFATADEAVRLDTFRTSLEWILPSRFFASGAEKANWINFDTWLKEQSIENPDIELYGDDICDIFYSSGTTGVPKGIIHSHANRLNMSQISNGMMNIGGDSVVIHAIGLYSHLSWVSLLDTLYNGGCFLLMETFDPAVMLKLIEKYRGTNLIMVPIMFQILLEHPEFGKSDIGSLRTVLSAGSPLFKDSKLKMIDRLGCEVTELYGLTEGFFTFLTPQNAMKKLGSVGKPMMGGDLLILDDDGNELPTGEQGEIAGRSAFFMKGYLNRPEATADTFHTDKKGRQWLLTGDIGKLDEDGFLYITDRKKDMIVSGGQNIFPTDIEVVAITHPEINEVAVIGIPHEKWGETPIAIVVTPDKRKSSPKELMKWINERVGKRQRISQLQFCDALPRNPMGKLLKKELRQLYKYSST